MSLGGCVEIGRAEPCGRVHHADQFAHLLLEPVVHDRPRPLQQGLQGLPVIGQGRPQDHRAVGVSLSR